MQIKLTPYRNSNIAYEESNDHTMTSNFLFFH